MAISPLPAHGAAWDTWAADIDAAARAGIGGGGGGSGSTLAVAATVSTSGTLLTAKHNPVDATSGTKAMALPTGAAAGTLLAVEKTDATANTVTVTGNVRGASGTVLTLFWQNEALLLAADTSGSWWPIAGHKTKTSLDAAYDATGAATTARAFAIQRANHTGTQAIGTVTGLQTALDAKLDTTTAAATYVAKVDAIDLESTQDSIAGMFTGGTHSGISFAYNDPGNVINATVTPGSVADATTTTKGAVQLAGDLAGTAASPTVPGLAGKANTSHTHGVTDLTATGTRDATTFLRGDNTWAVAGGGSSASNATATAPGLVQLAGDLGGTATVPLVKYDHALTAYGLTDTSFAKWRLAYSTARAGGAPAKVLCLGDSITAGGTTLTGDIWGISWPGRLRSYFDGRTGISGSTGLFDANPTAVTGNAEGYRPSIGSLTISSTGGGWGTFQGTNYGLIGLYYNSTAGATYTVNWTGSQTLRVHTARGIGPSTTSVTSTLDTVASTAISNGGSGPLATDYTPSGSGAHSLVLTITSGVQLNLLGLELINQVGGVTVHNAGVPGKTTAYFLGTPATSNPVNHAALVAPNLTVFQLGTNDMSAATVPVATYKTNMQTLITNARATGDAILITPPRDNGSGASPNSYADYCNALYQLSDTNNVPVLDLRNRYAANPNSWMDAIGHALVAGTYADMGAGVFSLATAHSY